MEALDMQGLLKPGDAVRLTRRFARVLVASRKHRVNWLTRHGVLHHLNSHAAFVVWHGNRARDQLPLKAIEKVP